MTKSSCAPAQNCDAVLRQHVATHQLTSSGKLLTSLIMHSITHSPTLTSQSQSLEIEIKPTHTYEPRTSAHTTQDHTIAEGASAYNTYIHTSELVHLVRHRAERHILNSSYSEYELVAETAAKHSRLLVPSNATRDSKVNAVTPATPNYHFENQSINRAGSKHPP
jgi:hypothetical protein